MMKDKWQVIFSGVGGQGLIVCSVALGEAAIQYEDKNAVMTTSHGVEMRGTFSKADIIISSERIDYPECLEPDAIVCLAQVAYDRYKDSVDDHTIIIYNDELVKGNGRKNHFGYPISAMAKQAGSSNSENFVSLGLLIGTTGMCEAEHVRQVILDKYKGGKFETINTAAYDIGMKVAAK